MLDNKEIGALLEGIKFGTLKHKYHESSLEIAEEIKETFSDNYPGFLKLDRPKETKAVKEYREKIYDNPVKGDLSRIIGKFAKIEQSEGFSQNFKKPKEGKNLLEEYTKRNFNGYNSLLQWTFSTAINTYITDPNAVVVVLDKKPPLSEAQEIKPYPYIFRSDDVLDFKKGQYAVLQEVTGVFNRNIYYIIDDTYYYIFTKNNNEFEYERVTHNCPLPPFFKIGQHLKDEDSAGDQLFKSTISDALPHFKNAIRRANDIEVEYNHHVSTREWSIAERACKVCKGKKRVVTTEGEITCGACKGTGHEQWDALGILYIDPKEDKFMGEDGAFPFNSPGGFVPRNIDSVKAMESAYDRHIDRGYEAIDFGTVLRERRGLSAESGDSKRYDRLEYSQKIYAEGVHIIENIMMPIYRFIDAQKFGYDESQDRIPDVTISISYDVMSPETILEEIKKMSDAGISGRPFGELLLKYEKIVTGEEAITTLALQDEIQLNPFYGKSVDELELLFGGGEDSATNVISLFNLTMAVNFKAFVDRAIREHFDWFKKDTIEKYEILEGYTQELIEAKKAAQKNTLGATLSRSQVAEEEQEVTDEDMAA